MSKHKTIKLGFVCQECNHHFKQRVPALYVDLNTMRQQVASNQSGAETHSPYIIPQRVVCPTCGQVDRFKLHLFSSLRVTLALFLRHYLPILAPRLIQPLSFGLSDGRQMHPLDALDMYEHQVALQPKHIELRLKYANLLHNLGYITEAETHYRMILKQDPTALVAMLTLGSIHAARGEIDQTRRYLELVAKRAPGSKHPRRQEFLADIQPYLDGKLALDTFEMEFQLHGPGASTPQPPPQSKPGGRKPRRSKRRRRKK